MLCKCCTQYTSKFGKLTSVHRTGKVSFHFHTNPKEGQCQRMFKLPYNCTHLTLVKQCSKFSKLGSNSTWTVNFQMFKLDLRKGRETKDQIANIHWIIEKAKEFQKTSTSVSLTMLKPLTAWITTNCGNFLKEMGIPDHLNLPPENPVYGSRSNS